MIADRSSERESDTYSIGRCLCLYCENDSGKPVGDMYIIGSERFCYSYAW